MRKEAQSKAAFDIDIGSMFGNKGRATGEVESRTADGKRAGRT
jgi:hypothetical protein